MTVAEFYAVSSYCNVEIDFSHVVALCVVASCVDDLDELPEKEFLVCQGTLNKKLFKYLKDWKIVEIYPTDDGNIGITVE